MASTTSQSADTVVVLNQTSGIALIPKPTTLTRLNYYDGKFLRATDMQAEQDYHRHAQQLAAQAGGVGVAHGFELRLLAGDQVELAAGLAIDPEGRLLHMPTDAAVQIDDLITRSRGTTLVKASGANLASGSAVFTLCDTAAVTPTTAVVAGTSLYVVGIAHAEALCGQEDVFGKLCEEACVSGTERPQRLEGVVLRALPLQLATALPTSKAVALETPHLRSRVASAYFADEARQIESLISGSGLLSNLWCSGAAPASGSFLPLAVLARAGGHTVFLDGWTARRERIDSSARRYWQWRMMMRPWDVFMAQVLQFQCQLRDAWQAQSGGDDDPCGDLKRAVLDVSDVLAQLDRQYRDTSVRLAATSSTAGSTTNKVSGTAASRAAAAAGAGTTLSAAAGNASAATTAAAAATAATAASAADATGLSRTLLASAVSSVNKAKLSGNFTLLPSDRVLIRRGIVELPSAGYLPVAPGSAIPVNEQVRRLLGDGVDLRFCVVRPDFVAEALQEAQHMQRISLLTGLDNPKQREEVDILVPDGEILSAASNQGAGWEVRLAQAATASINATVLAGAAAGASQTALATAAFQRSVMSGAARSEALADGSVSFFFAGLVETASRSAALTALKAWAGERDNGLEQTLWKSVELQNAPAAAATSGAAATGAAGAAPKGRARASAAAAAQPPAAPELSTRFAALRDEAVAYRLKTLERVANRATTSGIRHFEGLKDAPDADHVAAWLALHAEANPLTVAEGGRVNMRMDLSLISPKSGGTQFIDVGIVGAQFIVESRITSGQRLAVQGTLRGAAIIAGLVGTLANSQRGLQFSVPALVTSEPTDDGSSTRVEVDFSSLLFDGRGVLGIDKLGVRVLTAQGGQQAQVQVAIGAQGVDLTLTARLQRNDAVLKLGNPLRTASETAIDVLATRESSPNFATQARADLFGSKQPQADALTVRAKLDWVLFHRRRSKQCGAAPAAAVVEQRRYELHHLHVKSDAQLRQARAAVISANAATIRKLGFAPIGAVAFDGGRSSLATPTDALLADWDAAKPGSAIRFGAIGSQGAAQAEGDALAQARLAALELTLAQGEAEAALENQVLPVLPPLSLAGWDGAIFLITEDAKVICQDVVRLANQALFKRFASVAVKSGLQAALKQFQLQPFAHVDFLPDGKTIQPASLLALRSAWGDGGAPQDAALVFYSGSTANEAPAVVQTAAVLTALQGPAGGLKPLASSELAPTSNCGAIGVLVQPEPVTTAQVLVAFAPWDGRFIISANTLITSLAFQNNAPVDDNAFVAAVRTVLGQFQPRTLTTAVQTQGELAGTAPIQQTGDAAVAKLGYQGITISDTAVLTADEIKALEGRGFAPASYQFVLMFSTNRPG